METYQVTRKLAAILHADVQGYSRLMGEAEEATLRVLGAALAMMTTQVEQHGGRAVGSRGDSLLAEFPSVVAAVQSAVAMQRELRGINAELPAERRVEFRMGVNLGEIVVEGEQIHGDGINIAVRLEGLAEAGGICLSEVVYEQVRHRVPLEYEYVGERILKNIAQPVRVWRVVIEPAVAVSTGEGESLKSTVQSLRSKGESSTNRRVGIAHRNWATVAVVGLVLITGTIVAVRYLSLPTPSTQPRAPSTQTEPALPLPDKPSIAVLPFTNMSGDPEQEYFSDGMTDDIITDLSKFSALFVIARNSTFTYKGKAVPVQEVSKALGVRYVLEGSVRKAGERVRINAQLVEATTGHHLWAERYEQELKNLFTLQDEIIQQIVAMLQVEVLEAELERVRRIPTANLNAHDSLLRGVEYALRWTKEANAQARQLFERAIALDPQYAKAYALLGVTYWWDSYWSPDRQNLERAFALSQQAIALDDTLPEAHHFLGVAYQRKNQYEPAIAELERAVALDPNYADGYAGLATVLNSAGRSAEALGWVEKAMRLHPRYPFWYAFQLGLAYRQTGRYAEAITAQKQSLLRNSNNVFAYTELGSSYCLQWTSQLSQDPQTLEQALAAAQRAVALNDSFWLTHLVLGYVSLCQQQYEQALVEMERAVALDPTEAVSYAGLAEVLSRVGRWEEALKVAEQALYLKPIAADAHLHSVGIVYTLAGRYGGALAPLQSFLSRYPNDLNAHLTLAAVYSELGKEAEARAEAAEVLRINPQFSLEVHKQRVPIKDPAVLERHLAALRRAGLK